MQALDGVDIAFITESWLTKDSGDIIHIIKNYGFNIYRSDRGSKGGGIAVIYRNIECNSLVFPQHVSSSLTSFEHHAIRLETPHETYCIICIYRKQEVHVSDFLTEIDTLLDHATNKLDDSIIVLGDFNIHFDVKEKSSTDVINVFNNYQLTSTVTEPTHNHGHILDQIFYNENTLKFPLKPSVHSDLT